MNKLLDEIEKKIKQFRIGMNADYSLSDNGRGEKVYTVRSEELKKALHDVVHSTAHREWQITHRIGTGFIEYGKEEDGKFGLYQKSLSDDFDRFVLLIGSFAEGEFTEKRERYFKEKQEVEKSRLECEKSRQEVNEWLRSEQEQQQEQKKDVSSITTRIEREELSKGYSSLQEELDSVEQELADIDREMARGNQTKARIIQEEKPRLY